MKSIYTRFCAIFLCAATLLTGCGSTESTTDDNTEETTETASGEMRDMTAMEYADDMGLGINLGNTLEAYWEDLNNTTSGAQTIGENTPSNYETCWGATEITQEIVDGIAEAGFQTVRVPVYWGNMMEDDGTYTISEEWFDRVEEVIDYCIADDLYVVINIHHYDAYLIENHSQEEVVEAVDTLWTQIAERYADYGDLLIFEGFNESLGNTSEDESLTEDEIYTYVNELNQTFVDAVRETGGNNEERLLIVSGYWTNIDKTTDARFTMPTDTAADKLMVSVHYVDNSMYWSCQIGTEDWLTYAEEQCELLKAAFTDQNIPVFIGECTSIYAEEYFSDNATYTDSTTCLSLIMEMILSYDFVPVLWDVTDNFYSRTDCAIVNEDDANLILSLTSD